MANNRRRSEILKIMQDRVVCNAETLAKTLNVSVATIRRELIDMEREGLISRFHGGARLSDAQIFENSMQLKYALAKEEKQRIAQYAANLIKDGSTIFIDAGTSTLLMIDYIHAKDIKVYTIGIPHIQKLCEKHIQTIILGGQVKSNTQAVTGMMTVEQMEQLHFDYSFLGTNGISYQMGFTTPEQYEGMVKHLAIQRAEFSYVLADSTKFNKVFLVQFARLNEPNIIIARKRDDFDYSRVHYLIATDG